MVLYDSDWNPQQDIQAMDRAHRLGQKRDVVVYRFVTLGTMDVQLIKIAEEKRKLERIVTHHDHAVVLAGCFLGIGNEAENALFRGILATLQNERSRWRGWSQADFGRIASLL